MFWRLKVEGLTGIGLCPQRFRPRLELPEPVVLEQLLDNASSHTSRHGARWQRLFSLMAECGGYPRDSSDSECSTCSPTPTAGLLRRSYLLMR